MLLLPYIFYSQRINWEKPVVLLFYVLMVIQNVNLEKTNVDVYLVTMTTMVILLLVVHV